MKTKKEFISSNSSSNYIVLETKIVTKDTSSLEEACSFKSTVCDTIELDYYDNQECMDCHYYFQ